MNSKLDTKALSIRSNKPAALQWADIVIIGNGIAGLTAAIEARRYDKEKHVVIMTDQPHPTINTPALKQFSISKLKRDQLLAYPLGTERSLNIHVVNAHVEGIHAGSKYLVLDGNRAFGYGKLLIATGSRPVGLPEDLPGRTFDGVITLHRLKDYMDLRRRLPEVRKAVVIGGGMHANEVVMSLLHWGIRVHWLIRSKQFLPDVLDDTASDMILDKVRRAGAIIHTETEITAIIGRVASVIGVATNTNKMIDCQLVVSCTGTCPAEGVATRSTRPIMFNNGILVDSRLRTSVRDIYAAGDVAALLDPQTGEYKTNAQWYYAAMQGKVAGAMMVGHPEVANELVGVNWHATQLGKLSMLTVGDPRGVEQNEEVVIYTDTSRGVYRRLTTIDDRLVGYLSIGNTQPDGLSIKHLIDEGFSIRKILKPLLRGKFDVHEYLTRAKIYSTGNMETRLLPLLKLQALQWLKGGLTEPQPAIQTLPAVSQMGEIGREMQVQQMPAKATVYQSGQPPLSVEADPPTYCLVGQFAKPGFVDTRHEVRKTERALALSYEQPKKTSTTEPLQAAQLPFPVESDQSHYHLHAPYGGYRMSQNLATDPLLVGVGADQLAGEGNSMSQIAEEERKRYGWNAQKESSGKVPLALS